MPYWRNKKILLLILTVILLLVIPVLIYFLYFQKIGGGNKSDVKDTNIITGGILTNVGKNKIHFNEVQVREALDRLNNGSLSDLDRYEALKDLAFYFGTAYAASHKPELREYVNSLKSFAKDNFPKYYEEGLFDVGCADSVCGEKPDEEIKQIQKEINEAGIDADHLNTINKNLEQASYIPASEVDKKYGFTLVLHQLDQQNNPKASAAAMHLKDYLKKNGV